MNLDTDSFNKILLLNKNQFSNLFYLFYYYISEYILINYRSIHFINNRSVCKQIKFFIDQNVSDQK